jgi:hypothetical protein
MTSFLHPLTIHSCRLGKNLIPKAYCFGGLIPSIGDYRLPIYRIEDRQSKINNERTLHSDDNRPADCQRFLKSTQVAFTKFIKILHCCQQKSSDQSETQRNRCDQRRVAVFRPLEATSRSVGISATPDGNGGFLKKKGPMPNFTSIGPVMMQIHGVSHALLIAG